MAGWLADWLAGWLAGLCWLRSLLAAGRRKEDEEEMRTTADMLELEGARQIKRHN